ncbi:MAG: GTPase, partial [Planctomycetota bacterium]
ACLRLSGAGAIAAVAGLAPGGDEIRRSPGFRGLGVRLRIESAEVPAWVQVYRAPRSYTCEDLVEIFIPGSPPLVRLVSLALLRSGEGGLRAIRWARPGEFTLRAFLGGRIDLSQAEAVAALVSAEGEAEAAAARRSLRGEPSSRWRRISRGVIELLGVMEASLDFPDEDLPPIDRDEIARSIRALSAELERELAAAALRAPGSTAVRAALAGPPNSGKSSLLNAILGRPAALTSPVPGTTRDPVRGASECGGLRIEWIDLAGIPDARAPGGGPPMPESSRVVSEIVARLTRAELERADVVLWVADASDRPEDSARAFRSLEAPAKILVFQKGDLLGEEEAARLSALAERPSVVSARTGSGVRDLVRRVASAAFGQEAPGREAGRHLVTARQEAALRAARDHLERALESVRAGRGLEYAAADARDALAALDEIFGTTPRDEVLEAIFSRFCIGK